MSTTYDCGHGCKVTCEDGGGCVYSHTTGKCATFCNGDVEINCKDIAKNLKEGQKIDIKLYGVSLTDLERIMKSFGVY